MKTVLVVATFSVLSCGSFETDDLQHLPTSAAQEISEVLVEEKPTGTTKEDSLSSGLHFEPYGEYSSIRAQAKIARTQSRDNEHFVDLLLNKIIPHWYGTTWAFEGHTAKPNDGEIACGYFVSTTLQHMGLKLNRYRMAQQSALSEVRTIGGKDIQLLHPKADEVADLSFCSEMQDGLYIVGLSNHVGYFLWKEGNGYFIHSDYVNGKVTFENALRSVAFQSDVYCFAPISNNEELMKLWLGEKEVAVVMD